MKQKAPGHTEAKIHKYFSLSVALFLIFTLKELSHKFQLVTKLEKLATPDPEWQQSNGTKRLLLHTAAPTGMCVSCPWLFPNQNEVIHFYYKFGHCKHLQTLLLLLLDENL